MGDTVNIPPLSSVTEQSVAEADRAANALSGERAAQLVRLLRGLLGLPLLFQRLCAGFFSMLFFVFLSLVAMF